MGRGRVSVHKVVTGENLQLPESDRVNCQGKQVQREGKEAFFTELFTLFVYPGMKQGQIRPRFRVYENPVKPYKSRLYGISCFGPSDWIRTSGLLNPIQNYTVNHREICSVFSIILLTSHGLFAIIIL